MSAVRDCLGHLDTDRVWRDREGDTWRYVADVGWCWSREGTVLDEPQIPTYHDGPFTAIAVVVPLVEHEGHVYGLMADGGPYDLGTMP